MIKYDTDCITSQGKPESDVAVLPLATQENLIGRSLFELFHPSTKICHGKVSEMPNWLKGPPKIFHDDWKT